MKRVKGSFGIRALGDYDFEIYVDDNATDEEIEKEIESAVQYYCDYDVEDGYVAEQRTIYRKKYAWED